MSDKAHNPVDRGFAGPSGGWQTIFAPLASFWAILLTVLIVFAINGPGWLEELAARDKHSGRQADQEIMRDVRRITGAIAPGVTVSPVETR